MVLGCLAGLLLLGVPAAQWIQAADPGAVTVLVAERDLLPGDLLGDAALRPRQFPAALVPAGALERAEGVLATALPAGAVATDRHLTDGGWARHLAADRAAVALPAERLPHLEPGTRIALTASDHDGRAQQLAGEAVVLAVGTEEVWVALAREEATAVSGAAAVGLIGVVVLPP